MADNTVPVDDRQLLDEYATRNSEEAFRALVDRYAGMVYHTALRQVGNPHAAEEIAQAVFAVLAQKAGTLPRNTVLCGWLFRATRFAALNFVRKEATRRRYEQEAIAMETDPAQNEVDSVWEQIAPHLNDALDRLPQLEREAVMMRFLGEKSHKDVAELLGISEDNARKRVSRAVEKLRGIFARRGVTVSSIALVAAFTAHAAQAAPPSIISSISAAALAKGAAAASTLTIVKGTLKLMAWTKMKTSIVAGIALLLVGGATTAVVVINHAGTTSQQLPFVVDTSPEGQAASDQCVNQLKQIGLAARVWGMDNSGRFPSDFLSMTNELNNPTLLHCPGDKARSVNTWEDVATGKVSYRMLPKQVNETDANVVYVQCPIHGSILLCDGSVHKGSPALAKHLKVVNGRTVLEP